MHLPSTDANIPQRPQLHTRKHHHFYNNTDGTPSPLPHAIRVSSPTLADITEGEALSLVYEIKLYFHKNRACTIYRSLTDLKLLQDAHEVVWRKAGLKWMGEKDKACGSGHELLVSGFGEIEAGLVQMFLSKLLDQVKKQGRGGDAALEHFLRRRLADCDGRS